MANCGALRPHGRRGDRFCSRSPIIPLAGSLLGAGTELGAAISALVATYFGHHLLVFGASVFFTGLLCALARLDRSAYRFGGVTLAIVLLIPRAGPAWQIAFHRFAEVSIGIAVALLLARLWPEQESVPSKDP